MAKFNKDQNTIGIIVMMATTGVIAFGSLIFLVVNPDDDPLWLRIPVVVVAVGFAGVCFFAGISDFESVEIVPKHKILVQYNTQSKEELAYYPGEYYKPGNEDTWVSLHPQRVRGNHNPHVHGVKRDMFFTASYEPDPKQVLRYAALLKKNFGSQDGVSSFLAERCAENLCTDSPDAFTDVAKIYGVKFFDIRFNQPPEQDQRIRIRRVLESDFEASGVQIDMIGTIITNMNSAERGDHWIYKKYPDLDTPSGRRTIVDVLKQMLDRAKTVQ